MVTAWVSHIQIHPIKSLDATTLQQAGILSSGALEFDRTRAMFDANGKFVNGKRHAAVHRLRSVVDLADRKLSICAGREPIFTDPAFSLDGDREQIGRWLSGYFGFPVQLRENSGASDFQTIRRRPGQRSSVSPPWPKSRAGFRCRLSRSVDAFAPNIEIDGVPAFWRTVLFGTADTAVRFAIGGAAFEGINPCQRCVVPLRDPLSGVEDKTFVRRFTELRKQSLPSWSERSRFNHFYRVAVNTRPAGDQGGKIIRKGDTVRILENSLLQSDRAAMQSCSSRI